MNETFNPCSNETFPFTYFGVGGNPVSGILNNETGLCTFPEAVCGLETAVSDCCAAKPEVTETGSNYMFIAFAFIFAPYVYLSRQARKRPPKVEGEGDDDDLDDGEARVPSWVYKLGCLAVTLFRFGLMLYITLQIMVPIFMRNSLQSMLNVNARNALIASEAFLLPYREIFQFIEDIVLVRVNYALGRRDKKLTDQLVHAGMLGSFATGLAAALIATILGAIPVALRAMTNPGLANDQELYEGCEFVRDTTVGVLPYWLMEAWAIPGEQLGKVVSGFLLGAMQLDILGWIGTVSIAMVPVIWFTRVETSSNRLLLLGSAEFTADWMMPVLAILYMISPLGAELREYTGVNLSLTKMMRYWNETFGGQQKGSDTNGDGEETKQNEGDNETNGVSNGSTDEQNYTKDNDEPEPQSTKELLVEGLKIMVMDVTIQFCVSLTIYLALLSDGSVAYQLTALQSALPTYGIAYALGMGIMFKVIGPQLIAKKAYKVFCGYARVTALCAFLLPPLIIGTVIPFSTSMAFDYGGNACTYAKDEQCLPFFTNIFGPNGTGGHFTLPFTFNVFAVGASIEAVFFVMRAMLLALVDLDYMLKCTAASIVAYIPVICVATLVPSFGRQAAAFFVAMYIPQFMLIILFAIRLEVLLRRISGGQSGTWSSERNVTIGSSLRELPEAQDDMIEEHA